MIDNTEKIPFLEQYSFLPIILPDYCENCKGSVAFHRLREVIFQTEPKWLCQKCIESFSQLQLIQERISAKNQADTAAFIIKNNTTWIKLPHGQNIAIESKNQKVKTKSDKEFQTALTNSKITQTYSKSVLEPSYVYFLAYISMFETIFPTLEEWYFALERREKYRNQFEIQENLIYSKSHLGMICRSSYFSLENKRRFTLEDFDVKDGNYELKPGKISKELIGKATCYNKNFLDRILNILQSNNAFNSSLSSLFISEEYSHLIIELKEFGCSFRLNSERK